jgi:hypothetical protein
VGVLYRSFVLWMGEAMTPPSNSPFEAQGKPGKQGAETKLEAYWLIVFEDKGANPEVFTDETAARARFEQLRLSWSCWLFVSDAIHRQELAAAEEAQIAETVKFLRNVNDPAAEALAEYEKTHSTGALARHDAEIRERVLALIDSNTGPTGGWLISPKKMADEILALAASAANSPEPRTDGGR